MVAAGVNSNSAGPGAMITPQPGMQIPVFAQVDLNGNAVVSGAGSVGTPGVSRIEDGTTTNLAAVTANGAQITGVQAAFTVYTESAVVNGARLTNGNTTAASLTNQLQWIQVSAVVTALSGGSSPTLVYSFQVQDANSNWVTLASTPTISTTGTYVFSVGPGMANGQLVTAGVGQYRVSWAVTGVPTGVTAQIGVSGR